MLRRWRPDVGRLTGQPAAARAKHHVCLDQTGAASPQESRLRLTRYDARLKKSQSDVFSPGSLHPAQPVGCIPTACAWGGIEVAHYGLLARPDDAGQLRQLDGSLRRHADPQVDEAQAVSPSAGSSAASSQVTCASGVNSRITGTGSTVWPAARAWPWAINCARSEAVASGWGMVGSPTSPMMHERGSTSKRRTANPDLRLRAQARMRFRGSTGTRRYGFP